MPPQEYTPGPPECEQRSVCDQLLEACIAMLDAQSARRHPLGMPDEGIATICAEAASKARAAIARARGESN